MALTKDPDLTGWCQRGERHAQCNGTLYSGTGHHWLCACSCHPERTRRDISAAAPDKDAEAALTTFRAARHRLYPADVSRSPHQATHDEAGGEA